VGQLPTSATIEMFAPIWQQVLQRTSVHEEDNFFDLGGDPSSAARLFREIARIMGRELPPVTIFQAPTMMSLAALLQQSRPPQFPALVELKAGAERPPIYLKHGMGGSVMEIFPLARAIQSQHAVLAMQTGGFEGYDEPVATVEDLAELHLNAIQQIQPRGPYALIGYSFGGLVMMEIAQRLQESGEKIAMLAMVETYPHRRFLPLRMRMGLYESAFRYHTANARTLPMRQKMEYLTSRSARTSHASRDQKGIVNETPENGLLGAPGRERVKHSETLALERYRPRYYKGKITFVKSAKNYFVFPDDARAVWKDLAREFEMDIVPGDHFEIVTTYCRELGSVLSRHLATAFSKEQGA
jgi:acetoacetyl-CoA synthetase